MILINKTSKILCLLCFSVLLLFPINVRAGVNPIDIIDQTDFGSNRLVIYWDTRSRETLFQIANISQSQVTIHVQIFDVADEVIQCTEQDFDDTYTGNDTHLYNIENLDANDGSNPNVTIPSDHYGFVVISLTSGDPNSLIGVFTIFDDSGYQYRTNAASPEDANANSTLEQVINFNDANGNILSDLVGIPYVSLNSSDVYASTGVSATFGDINNPVLIYDEDEDPTACSPATFSCALGQMDRAIDNSLPNSKGQINRLCATSMLNSNDSGWLLLPFQSFSCTDPFAGDPETGECDFTPYFVGFIGLNNGDGTGSMDSWWSVGGLI